VVNGESGNIRREFSTGKGVGIAFKGFIVNRWLSSGTQKSSVQ